MVFYFYVSWIVVAKKAWISCLQKLVPVPDRLILLNIIHTFTQVVAIRGMLSLK